MSTPNSTPLAPQNLMGPAGGGRYCRPTCRQEKHAEHLEEPDWEAIHTSADLQDSYHRVCAVLDGVDIRLSKDELVYLKYVKWTREDKWNESPDNTTSVEFEEVVKMFE